MSELFRPTVARRVRGAVPLAVATLLGLPASSSLGAQEPLGGAARDTAGLRPVVVTATRLPVPQAAPTASATVITGAELRARGITHVMDALRDVPGAALVQNGSFGATTSLFLRGGENKYVQVLIDGVPVNDAGGTFNFANLTTDNVERIEVLRGPASVLYGSDAVTGVVQIFTSRGTPATRGDLALRGGSFGTREYEGQASGRVAGLGWSAGAQRLGSDGILAFNNEYRNESGSGALRWARDGVGDASLAVRVQRARFNFPTNSAGVPVDSNAFRRDERATLSFDAGRFVRPALELRTQLGLAGLRARNDDRRDGVADTVGFSAGYVSIDGTTRRNADVRANWYAAPRTVLTVGGDFRDVDYRMADTTVLARGEAPGRPLSAGRTTRAAYGQLLGDVGGLLTFTAGARYDDNSAFGAFRTGRAGLGLNLPSRTTLRVSTGNAFREPTMMENFSRAPFNAGNPTLRPERTRSVEAGVSQQLLGGRASLGATWYLQRFRDVIQYGAARPTAAGDSANYFNLARANAGGVELEARLAPGAGLDVGASWTQVDTRVVDAGAERGPGALFVEGGTLLRRPRQLASLVVMRGVAGRGSASVRVSYTGRRDDREFRPDFSVRRVTLPGFVTVNLATEAVLTRARTASPGVTLTARAENLLDREYAPILGFRAPGRTVVVGLRLDAGR